MSEYIEEINHKMFTTHLLSLEPIKACAVSHDSTRFGDLTNYTDFIRWSDDLCDATHRMFFYFFLFCVYKTNQPYAVCPFTNDSDVYV